MRREIDCPSGAVLVILSGEDLMRAACDDEYIRKQRAVLADWKKRYPLVPQTPSYSQYLLTSHWRKVRKAAIERADGHCQLCGETQRLEVHHNTYQRLGEEKPTDVVCLCRECHVMFHKHKRLVGSMNSSEAMGMLP